MITVPEVMDSSRLRHRKNVLLPEPEGPMRQTTSLAAISQLMPFSTSTLPNDLCRSVTEIICFLQHRAVAHGRAGPRPPAQGSAVCPGPGKRYRESHLVPTTEAAKRITDEEVHRSDHHECPQRLHGRSAHDLSRLRQVNEPNHRNQRGVLDHRQQDADPRRHHDPHRLRHDDVSELTEEPKAQSLGGLVLTTRH